MPNFPNTDGGPSAGPGLNPLLQYCSTSGDDSNDGLTWQSAKKTLTAALAYLHPLAGGEIHFADNVEGNIWMRDDGLSVPGFVSSVSLRVVGHSNAHSSFGEPCAVLKGGSSGVGSDRFHPQIWITASGSKPFTLENMIPYGGVTNQILRTWDYRRKGNGSIAWANITSWDRTHANTGAVNADTGYGDGRATVTVGLGDTFNIDSIARVSNVTRINFTAITNVAPPLTLVGGRPSWVRVTSTNVNFPSGDYPVLDTDKATFFTYADPGSNASASNAGAWASSGVNVGDRIEVVSTQSTTNLPTCAYKVLSVIDAGSFVVLDNYGGQARSGGNWPSTGTFANPGTYVVQRRDYASGLITIRNCQGGSSFVTGDQFVNGPTIDIGGTTDGRIVLENTAFNGMSDSHHIGCVDPDRACWLLADGGVAGSPGLYVRFARPAAGGMRIFGSNQASWAINATDVYGDIDAADSSAAPPQLEVLNGNSGGVVYAESVLTFDADNDVDQIVLRSGMEGADVRVINCGKASGAGQINGGISQSAFSAATVSPIANNQFGPWVGNRISGRTADGFRTIGGISTARYNNKIPDPGSWTLNGVTLTTSQSDPFGGTGAVKLAGTANVFLYLVNQAVLAADRWIFATWAKSSGGFGGELISMSNGIALQRPVTFKGDGEWQLHVLGVVMGSNSTIDLKAQVSVGPADTYLFQPTLIKIPAADGVSDNEFAEFCQSFRTNANYLKAGMDGSGAGRKFIGHGGFGTNSANAKTVGVGSGQLTLTGSGTVYLPMYDADGTTIIGWVAQLQATVNP